jgi:uncharacterized protein YuzE
MQDMTDPIYQYDEESDTLSISFAPGEHATGIELTDHILLRINTQERRVVGITLLDYSVIAQPNRDGATKFPTRWIGAPAARSPCYGSRSATSASCT